MGTPTAMRFPNRSDTNHATQSQNQAESLKFRIKEEEEVYYPRSQNKGTDQLCGYREADLRHCCHIWRLLLFPCGGSNVLMDTCFVKEMRRTGSGLFQYEPDTRSI